MRKAWKLERIRRGVLVPLGIAALVSVAIGIRHAMQYGCHDLQWMGARLVGQRIDPWQEDLARFPHHYLHFSPPNYLHLLYLILLPLGLLSFQAAAILWTAGTVCLSAICVLVLRRLFHLDGFQAALALCLLWMSTSFRVVLEVGQMSFFELFFLAGAYLAVSSALGGLSFGVSMVKYSFSPVAVMLFLFRGRVRFLLYAAGISMVGLVGVWMLVGTPIYMLALEPLRVSSAPTAVSPGFADLMTLAEHALKSHIALSRAREFAYALGLLGSAAYAFLLSRFPLSRSSELTLISVASLFFVKHLVYDYVFLVVLLCFALTQKSMKVKGLLIAGVVTFWFVLPFFFKRAQDDNDVHLGQLAIRFCLLTALLAFTTYQILARTEDETLKDDELEPELSI